MGHLRGKDGRGLIAEERNRQQRGGRAEKTEPMMG